MTYFSDPDYFDPHVVHVLHAALDRAWAMILSAEPSNAARQHDVRLVLAAGVIEAANRGERDIERLSSAACRYWASAIGEREMSLTLH